MSQGYHDQQRPSRAGPCCHSFSLDVFLLRAQTVGWSRAQEDLLCLVDHGGDPHSVFLELPKWQALSWFRLFIIFNFVPLYTDIRTEYWALRRPSAPRLWDCPCLAGRQCASSQEPPEGCCRLSSFQGWLLPWQRRSVEWTRRAWRCRIFCRPWCRR